MLRSSALGQFSPHVCMYVSLYSKHGVRCLIIWIFAFLLGIHHQMRTVDFGTHLSGNVAFLC